MDDPAVVASRLESAAAHAAWNAATADGRLPADPAPGIRELYDRVLQADAHYEAAKQAAIAAAPSPHLTPSDVRDLMRRLATVLPGSRPGLSGTEWLAASGT